MPYTVLIGKDAKGSYAISSERLHSKKYYFTTPIGKQRAILKVEKQNRAIILSEIRRGKL